MKTEIAVTCVLMLCTTVLHADSLTEPSIAPDAIYVTNGVSKDIIFYLSPNGHDWTEFKLISGGSQTISVEGPSGSLQVAIQTADRKCQVPVQTKKRYEIVWDSQQQVYCVRELGPR